LSDPLEAATPTAACVPPTEARAARLAKFKREQLIVDFLNRGVSVAEIAARIGVGEKRMRAVIREILSRRMPAPPEEFAAIQFSRLNEALLVAFSAMSPTNLKAVDQVVKIVRELDRYGGAFAAEWARSETSRLDAPDDEDAAFASAGLYGAEPALQDVESASPDLAGDARPEISMQRLEKVESAPEFVPPAPRERGEGRPPDLIQDQVRGEGLGRLAAAADRPAPHPSLLPANGEKGRSAAPARDDRRQNPLQDIETIQSAPGNGWLERAASGSGSLPSPLIPYPIRPDRVRTTLNGVMAC
jgi:hypothetical protein